MINALSEEKFDVLKAKHNLSEGDVECLHMLLSLIRLTGYSPRFTLKLMKALTEMLEAVIAERDTEKKKEKEASGKKTESSS